MFSIPVFSNALFADPDQPRLHLVDCAGNPALSTQREVRRDIERLQTKAFVHDALEEAQLSSKYALDRKLTKGVPGSHFPFDRPKMGDRMARIGEPAIAKYLKPDGRRIDVRTKPRIDKLIAMAPKTSAELLSLPLWRLLDPRLIAHVEWHKLGWDHVQLMLARLRDRNQSHGPTAAWQIFIHPSSHEPALELYVCYVGCCPDRAQLISHLLQIRRWEATGDLIAYDLALHQALRAARHPTAAPDLACLQPSIGNFIASRFGSIVVPHHAHNLTFQQERLEVGRQAWKTRVLVGNGVTQPEFQEPM